MMFNKNIVPGMLVKIGKGLGNHINYGDRRDNSKDRFYILTELETKVGYCDEDMLVFYGLFEERFFRRPHWFIEKYIEDGFTVIVA